MIKKFLSSVNRLRQSHEDAKLGRQLVGYDKNNNRYYQYYDQNGKETKRICEYINKLSDQKIDPVWEQWIRKIQKIPFTPEELEQIYSDAIQFQKIVHQYEIRDAEMMNNYRNIQQKASVQPKVQNQDYKPGEWSPKNKTGK